MNVLTLQMLLHYYSRCSEYQGAPGDGPQHLESIAVRDAYNFLIRNELLQPTNSGDWPFKTTERGNAFVEKLQTLPLPVKRWVCE